MQTQHRMGTHRSGTDQGLAVCVLVCKGSSDAPTAVTNVAAM